MLLLGASLSSPGSLFSHVPRGFIALSVSLLSLAGCGENAGPSEAQAAKRAPDASTPDDAGAPSKYQLTNTGDCTTGKWSDVSDACWGCLCERCASALEACDESCQRFMNCQSAACFVGSQDEMNCEIRCATSQCLNGDLSAALAASDLDTCSIDSSPNDAFRSCEAECGYSYAGDTCSKY